VNEPRKDDERLSALLDGRIEDPQRRELLAHLYASDEDYTVFTDTALILRQLEEGAHAGGRRGTAAPSLPPSMRKRGWLLRAALPAGVAALLLAILWVSRERAADAGDPVHLAARLEASGRGLPPEWEDDRPWAVIRGNGAVPARTPRERAVASVQAGAMLTDLAVSVRAGDTVRTRLLADQVRAHFAPAAGRGTPLRQIAERAGAPPSSLEPLLERATDSLEGRLEKVHLQLGAWVQAARLAAHRGDAAFFEGAASRRMLDRAEQLTAGGSTARAALDRVRTHLAAETPAWDALRRDLRELLGALAS
jgi:hypothetical protein